MNVLAVDTCSGQGSLALGSDDGWSEVVGLSAEWKSTTLHTELVRLLARHSLKTADIDGYAVANGPGGFTGLRLGLTAVKAIAEVHGKTIVSVSTLECLAVAGRTMLPDDFSGEIVSLLDARRGQIFGAMYRVKGQNLRPLIGDCVCSLSSFLERVRDTPNCGDVRFCASEIGVYSDQIKNAGWPQSALLAVPQSLAGTLLRIGIQRLKMGQAASPAPAEANYVRASDAELFWKG